MRQSVKNHPVFLAALCVVLTPVLSAQEPQLVWKGEVDGAAVLRVHKKKVSLEPGSGRVAGRPSFRFAQPLPDRRQEARVEMLEGRGSVRILEQPRADNDYSLSVSIEDRQPGPSPYSLAFYWDAKDDGSAELKILKARRRESVTWNGRVEGNVIVNCRGDSCEAATTGGEPVRECSFRFTKPLPGRETFVALVSKSGRADVRLFEQPSESNNYTARVSIRDPHAGSGAYSFTLAWLPAKDAPLKVSRPGMFWSGRVQGTARVTVHGHAAATNALAGGTVTGVRAQFERGLPDLDGTDVVLKKLRGRGEMRIIERPSKSNGWTLVFEAADGGPGADDYEVEVRW